MHIEDPKLQTELTELAVELRARASLAELTHLGIGGTTDLLRITKHESIPALIALLERHQIPYKFLGGGSNLLDCYGELPWAVSEYVLEFASAKSTFSALVNVSYKSSSAMKFPLNTVALRCSVMI